MAKQFHLQTPVKTYLGALQVSTIHLAARWGGGYETCLFFADNGNEVVDSYGNEADARAGHAAWSNPGVALHAIKAREVARKLQAIEKLLADCDVPESLLEVPEWLKDHV